MLTCGEMRLLEELRQLALELLEIEKKYLLEERQDYCCAVVVVITPEGRYYEEADFEDEVEKDAAYEAIAERAKARNAIAIIPINTGREKDVEDEREFDSYRVGQIGGGKSSALPVRHHLWARYKTSESEPALFCRKRQGRLGKANEL